MPGKTDRASDGASAEGRAAEFLEQSGLRIVARNYRSPHGEIDLIMEQGLTLVFVEVRFRGRDDFGTPVETIDRRKQSRLRATAEHYLQRDQRASKRPCRFDIVAISGLTGGDRLEWIRDAF